MAELLALRAHRTEIPEARKFQFPDSVPFPQLQQVFDEYGRLKAELDAVYEEFAKVQEKRQEAVSRDRKAVGDAIRQGGKEPPPTEVDRIDKHLEQLVRREEGIDTALTAVIDEALRLVQENAAEWLSDLEGRVARQRGVYRKAVDTAEASRNELMSLLGLVRWFTHFPEQRAFAPAVRSLRGVIRHDDEAAPMRVFDALRKDAEPPFRPPSHGVPPIEQAWPAQGIGS